MSDFDSKPFSLVEKGGSDENLKSTDDIIEEIGFGKFHIHLLLLTGIAISCEAMELTLLTYLQGCAAAEWNLSSNEKSMLGGSITTGQLVGLLVFGTLADRYGRRILILSGWFLIIVFGMFSAISSNIWVLLFFRFFVGVGIASQVIMFDLAVELLPSDMRGKLLTLCSIFFVFGELLISGLAYLLLEKFGWRWLVFYTALPTIIITMFGIWFLPESPRWLVSQNSINDAEIVLSRICIINKRVIPSYHLRGVYGEVYREGNFMELISENLFNSTKHIWIIWYDFI